jgi:ceramide glucosyltransferase
VSLVQAAVAATATSLVLYATMMALFARAMWRRARRTKSPAPAVDGAPLVTIFKPLAGSDDDLEANLESFARIDYPCFEILFGVADPSDPAAALARRFVARHPKVNARVVVTDPNAATNPKVAQLIGLERVAAGEIYVISDSNVRVRPAYLWSLVCELADERVGIATSLFAGTGEQTLGAALENLQLCASTAPGLVAMDTVSARPFTVGKSMAVRRQDLARLGGFESVGEVLAEDHVLGRRFLDAGFQARTSLEAVENRNIGCTLKRTLERHTRWAKMRRALFPAGFFGEPVLTPIVVASVSAVIAPSKPTAAALAVACVAQTACALSAVRVLRGHWLGWWYAPLEVVRSYMTLFCWARACVSRRIEWRGHAFTLLRGSVIVPRQDSASQSVKPASERGARLAA